MEAFLGPLLPLFERERAAGRAVALGVLVHTEGSTYRKPGALILIAAQGEYAGLISGGCLEGDLREHARAVIDSGQARLVNYDTRGEDDLLWGMGLGCEGVMRVLLLRAGPSNDWQPLTHLATALAANQRTAFGVITESRSASLPTGTLVLPGAAADAAPANTPAAQAALARVTTQAAAQWLEEADRRLFVVPLSLPPRLLLCGAGPDTVPVVDFAARLGWKVTLVDHRAAYANPAHFPAAEQVLLAGGDALGALIDLKGYAAAVVMSHHLLSDLGYLRTLAASPIPYIGLLGPAARRDRLLQELAGAAASLHGRLHAPVGLPLGGRSPEAVALAIIAEVQSVLQSVGSSADASRGSIGSPSDHRFT
jgi:xanthine dehydrogenase accessory factor